jgi:hypothetical protein
MRQTTVLALFLALGLHVLWADVAAAGGRRHASRGFHGRGGPPVHRHVPVVPDGPPKSAFGSPGGFPFPDAAARERAARIHFGGKVFHGKVFPRHAVVSFASPLALYAPGFPYVPTVDAAPSVITVAPVIYATPTIYVSQPAVAPPSPVLAAASPEPPFARVVEHPTGRYELRGDGAATPYEWVWVPHPPAAPPAAASPSTEEAPPGPARATGRGVAYRWSDEDGTLFVTNRLDRVPEAHRARARGTAQ